MNKKALFTIILSSTLMISGCEKIKELMTFTIKTQFETEFPVVVTEFGVKSSEGTSEGAPIQFNVTETIRIEDNFDLEPYINKIKKINLDTLVVTVTGLTQGQIINTVSLDVEGIGNIITLNNISMTNNKFTPDIAQTKFDSVASKLLNDKQITATVSGNTSGPLSVTLGISIDARVITYIIE